MTESQEPTKPSKQGDFKPKNRRETRKLLMQAIYQWQVAETASSDLEAQFRAQDSMLEADVTYFIEVLRGVMSNIKELDELYEPYLDRSLDQLDPIEKAILRLGAFELSKRPDIPYQVVLNEGIELAKTFGAEDSHKYVNGILDRLSQRARRTEFEAYRQRKGKKNNPKT